MILLFRFQKQAAFTYVAKESCLSIQHGSTNLPVCISGAPEGLGTRLAHSGVVPGEWRRNDLFECIQLCESNMSEGARKSLFLSLLCLLLIFAYCTQKMENQRQERPEMEANKFEWKG